MIGRRTAVDAGSGDGRKSKYKNSARSATIRNNDMVAQSRSNDVARRRPTADAPRAVIITEG